MKVLVTGNSHRSGSWAVRAEQLARAAGAEVVPRSTAVAGYDVCVAVKRHDPELSKVCRAAGVPFVWDIVDPWPQPAGNSWGEPEAKSWLHNELLRVRPELVLAATKAMAADIQTFGFRAICVPHHHRPTARNEIRPEVRTLVYDGGLQQLGAWAPVLADICNGRGWRLLAGQLSAEEYAQADIVLALRDGAGYAPRHWKSGVKLANAQAAGIPFIGSPEQGYLETRVPGCERFVRDDKELLTALRALEPHRERKRVADWMATVSEAHTLQNVAQRWSDAVASVLR